MKSKVSERCALAALIALVVYCLACFYPVAWSPDSKKLVFPVFGEDRIAALVMTDLSGKAIRDVARVPAGVKDTTLSPAAWSPDGKWIAYFKLTKKLQNDVETISAELMLQAADSGNDRLLLGFSYPKGKDELFGSELYGPGWLGDSKTLTIESVSAGKPVVLLVGLDGKIQREIPLPADGIARQTAAVAPDGKSLAYFEQAEEKTATLVVSDITSGKARKLAPTKVYVTPFLRPVWSADSSTLLYVSMAGEDGHGQLRKIDVQTGKEKVLWQPENVVVVYGISVSAATDWIAVDRVIEPDKGQVYMTNVINATTGEVRPVSYGSLDMNLSMSISPDGKWVAFCPSGGDKRKAPVFGVIVSNDGAQMNFFLPDPKLKEKIPKFMSNRLGAAFTASGALEQLKKDGVDAEDVKTPEQAAAVGAALDKFAAGQTSPLFRQASAYGKVQAYFEMIRNQPAADRAKYAGEAQKIIDAFLKDYPGAEPVREELKAQLDEILPAARPS